MDANTQQPTENNPPPRPVDIGFVPEPRVRREHPFLRRLAIGIFVLMLMVFSAAAGNIYSAHRLLWVDFQADNWKHMVRLVDNKEVKEVYFLQGRQAGQAELKDELAAAAEKKNQVLTAQNQELRSGLSETTKENQRLRDENKDLQHYIQRGEKLLEEMNTELITLRSAQGKATNAAVLPPPAGPTASQGPSTGGGRLESDTSSKPAAAAPPKAAAQASDQDSVERDLKERAHATRQAPPPTRGERAREPAPRPAPPAERTARKDRTWTPSTPLPRSKGYDGDSWTPSQPLPGSEARRGKTEKWHPSDPLPSSEGRQYRRDDGGTVTYGDGQETSRGRLDRSQPAFSYQGD